MSKNIIVLIIIIAILLTGNIFLGIKYYSINTQFQKIVVTSKINTNVLTFNKLFVEKVLKTQGEVSYEDRLRLENAVVGTKDDSMVNEWHNLLASATELEAQKSVLVLLSMFPDKIILN